MSQNGAQATISSRQTDTAARRWVIALYLIVAFAFWTALNVYLPTLPTYVQSKSDNLSTVGIVLSMYGLWRGITALPAGIIAEWLGQRKLFIAAGCVLSALGAWLMGVASGTTGLAVGRATTGVAAGTWALTVVAFGSLFPPKEAMRAIALLTFVGTAASMIAAALTGFLNELGGYSLPFFVAAASAMLALLMVLVLREEDHPRRTPSVGGIGSTIRRREVLLPALLNGTAVYASQGTRLSFLPVLAKELGATDVTLSLMTSLGLAVMVAGNLIVTVVVKRTGGQRLVFLSFLLLTVGVIGAAVVPSVPLMYVVQCFIGLGTGISFPVLLGMSTEGISPDQRSIAVGLNQALTALGMFAGPWFSGMIADAVGIRPMFGITAAICLCLGLLGTRLLARRGTSASRMTPRRDL